MYIAREYIITTAEPLGNSGNGIGVLVANLELFFNMTPNSILEFATQMHNALVGLQTESIRC